MSNKNIQSHSLIANRIAGMLRALYQINKPTDEQKAAIKDLQDEEDEHRRKSRLTGDTYIVIT